MKENKVYLLECQGFYKIGKTTTPTESRIKGMSTGNPFDITCVAEVYRTDCGSLEAHLHSKFASTRVRGEWFSLTEEDIGYISNLASSKYAGNSAEETSPLLQVMEYTTEETPYAVTADGYQLAKGDEVWLIIPHGVKRKVVIDFIKVPEYINGVLEYVAISDPFIDVTQYLNSCEWTSPRYLYKKEPA